MKIYWIVTSWIPRPLPRSKAEWEKFKKVLSLFLNVPNEPQSWATVAGHVSAIPSHNTRKPYRYFANVAKRLAINKLAQDERSLALQTIKESLEAKMKELVDKEAAEIMAAGEPKLVVQTPSDEPPMFTESSLEAVKCQNTIPQTDSQN